MTTDEPEEPGGDGTTGAAATAGGQLDDYLALGENPFASAYPAGYQQGGGDFRPVQSRELPGDENPASDDEPARDVSRSAESPEDGVPSSEVPPDEPARHAVIASDESPSQDALAGLPVMEPLPDLDTLPDPSYLGMTSYQRAVPSAASSFPSPPQRSAFPAPPAFPPAPPTSAAAGWPPVPGEAGGDPEPSADAYREQPANGYRDWPPDEPDEQPTVYGDPYQAPRAPGEAPPLRGPAVPPSEVASASRPADAPPLDVPQHAPAPVAPASPPAWASEPPPPTPEPRPMAEPWPVPEPLPTPEPLPAAESLPTPEPLPPAGPLPPARPLPPAGPPARETADSLTTDLLLPGKRAAPAVGWRRTVYRASGGLIRVGESAADLRRRDLVSRVRTPVAGGHHRVAVMSLKGGVGKTTAAVALGSTLASLRGDRVIAVDGNPDRGTLSDKVRLETSATIRDLLNERSQVSRYADVRAFTSQASSRLEILASDRDPGVSVAFSADDYRAVARVLEHYYSICITDCGTGLLHSAMAGILELADQIVLVSSPSVDGARSASATLDWLDAHSYGDLVRNGVVVLSMIRAKSKSTVDLDRLEAHFAARSRAVVRVPYDPHLEEGAEVELDMLNSGTADAYLTLAALVGDGFAAPRHPVSWLTSAAPFA